MKTVMVGEKALSQLSLGTVQLGMNYGIANCDGKPSLEQGMEVLQAAVDGGITSLDTAAAYGDSEHVIGTFLRGYARREELFLTTKCVVDLPDGAPAAQVKAQIRASLDRSLENLGVEQVGCLMLHHAKDYVRFGDVVAQTFDELVQAGKIVCAGISIYHPEDLDGVLQDGVVSVVQAPMNLMDHALAESPHMAEMQRKGILLIARSIFLQGLFFLNPATMIDPDLLAAAAPVLCRIREIAQEEHMSVAQLAVTYIRDMPGVTGVVLGAEKPNQIKENLAYFANGAANISAGARTKIDEECAADIARIMKVLSRPK